ncbi:MULTISPECIES: hypothetical protein [Haloferacaceae]|uniref:Uncharacterized protein n=2 Tax=Haloferacaceae TaxID=1644056 RepID=A0ABD6DB15_9EURY|nr:MULTISPECIES: hypothetical protein [Halorubraceae]
MSFEDGSEPMQDPFSEEEGGDDTELEPDEETEPVEDTRDEQSTTSGTEQVGTRTTTADPAPKVEQDSARGRNVPELGDVDILRRYSPEEIAQLLMDREYHEEDPQVPYAMWRDGTSTGRSRTTIELNPDLDDLVKTVRREFENRYDAEINKADVREFAMIYGLMNADDLFEMAEEWGLQFNS